MKTTRCQLLSVIFAATAPVTLTAQVPNTLLYSIPAPPVGLQSGAGLGSSVAVDGAYTVVGAPEDTIGDYHSGVVKVFDSESGALRYTLNNPKPEAYDRFGAALAISGTRVVVGTLQAGSAYVYDLGTGTPTSPVVRLNSPDSDAGGGFGASVAISGMRVVVGSPNADAGAVDSGSAYVYDLSSGTPTVPVATLTMTKPNPAGFDYFGWSVAISGTRVLVGARGGENTGASTVGSAYVYDLSSGTPTVPVATLNNPRPAESDFFGWSLAISGTRAVVGAYAYDAEAEGAGSAYVYDLSNGAPTVPVATLNNPSPAERDQFGLSVAISDTRVVVGAPSDDDGALDAGIAYVYELSNATPTLPVATLNNPSPEGYDLFGSSVAVSATRVVVGGPNDDTGATNAGSAYVYDLSNGTPTMPVSTLNDPGLAAADGFGISVAVSGTCVVVGAGAGGPETGGSREGIAYVYEATAGAPTMPVATLNNPSRAGYDYFGWSVAIDGTRVVVGAVNEDTGATDAGSAYVYDLSSGMPTVPLATLNNPSPAVSDNFSTSVGISGTRVAVGAPTDDAGASDAGSAYVYDLSSATPTVPVATMSNPAPAEDDRFGNSVAIFGMRVVVGAYQDDTGAPDAGSAYVYDLSSATPAVPVATLNNPSPGAYENFGSAVAIFGTRVVVGAPNDTTGALQAGSAYVYDLSSATPTVPVATLKDPSPDAYGLFGNSVSVSGTRVVVGAQQDDTGAPDAGSAYVYDLGSATPTVPVATLNNPGPAVNDQFGFSVAIDGTTVAIGTPLDDTVITDKGSVYIYGPASSPVDADEDGLLDSWELTYWPTTAGHSPLDDFDHDGTPELLELAFGLNPTLADAGGLPAVTVEGVYLTLTLTKHPGVTYEVQSAGTLLPAQPDSFSAATTTVPINDATTLKVHDTVPIGTAPARFMRAKVTAAP